METVKAIVTTTPIVDPSAEYLVPSPGVPGYVHAWCAQSVSGQADGSNVGYLPDLTGGGSNLVNATSVVKLKASLDPAMSLLEFTTSQVNNGALLSGATSGQTWTVATVMRADVDASQFIRLPGWVIGRAGGNWAIFGAAGHTLGGAPTGLQVLTATLSPGSVQLTVGNSASTVGNIQPGTGQLFGLGCTNTPTQPLHVGDMYVWPTILSGAQLSSVREMLKARHNIA